MKSSEAGQVLGILVAGFHRESLEDATVDLWMEIIEPLEAELATKVALGWVKNQDRFPSISQFRHAYHVEKRRLEPHEPLAPLEAPGPLGLPESGQPGWARRWGRARGEAARIQADQGHKMMLERGDFRVFQEQVVGESKYTDDPRYTTAEAAEIGLMPDDAWV